MIGVLGLVLAGPVLGLLQPSIEGALRQPEALGKLGALAVEVGNGPLQIAVLYLFDGNELGAKGRIGY